MNTLTNIGATPGQAASTPMPMPNSAAGQKIVRSDAEVVSSVASMEIKASSVNETSAPTREVVAKAAQQIQSFVQSMGRNLNFSVDSTTGYHVVRVTNPDTGEIIRQLPSEELLRIAQSFAQINSALVNQKA
jgi:flagellar protein FlaG